MTQGTSMKYLLSLLLLFLVACNPNYNDLANATVKLVLDNDGPYGSGVIVGLEDTVYTDNVNTTPICKVTVATAGHIVDLGNKLTIEPNEGIYPLLSFRHKYHDIGYLIYNLPEVCKTYGYSKVNITYRVLQPLDKLVHIGYPQGLWMIGYSTYITPYKSEEGQVVGVITSVAGPGSSGGPVFYKGKLVGIIVSGEQTDAWGGPGNPFRNFMTPIDLLDDILPSGIIYNG